jgi:hypothetical protein
MPSHPQFGAQTLLVLAALCDQPVQWQDRSALAAQTRRSSASRRTADRMSICPPTVNLGSAARY